MAKAKHLKVSAVADGPDADLVRPSDWNADHTIEMDGPGIIGRTDSGAGAVSELSAATTKTFLGIGTAADQNTGTSGATVPLLNGTNTWSGVNNFSAGLGIGTTSLTGFNLRSLRNITGATTAYGIVSDSTTQSDVTSAVNNFYSGAATQAASFTLGTFRHFVAVQSTFGAGSTVTNQEGFTAFSNLTGATNNYGFRNQIPAGTGRWAFFDSGGANSAFLGNVRIGSTVAPTVALDVTGNVTVSGTLTVGGTAVQLSDPQLDSIAALSYPGNGLKVVRVNAGETAFELAAISGTGDVVGPASSTDNAITRYDGTSGKAVQNSAATISDDGVIRSATNSGANPVSVPLCNWVMLTADYTLTSAVTEQKYFNTTANGALTLPAGVYEFEWFAYLTTMSATSGNAAFDPVGGGTAVTDRWGQTVVGIDSTTPLNAGTQTGSAAVTQQTVASAVTAGTGTGMQARIMGMFRVSTGGTIIPSITLVTANAAVAKAGSYFKIKKVGESSETSVGAWT